MYVKVEVETGGANEVFPLDLKWKVELGFDVKVKEEMNVDMENDHRNWNIFR